MRCARDMCGSHSDINRATVRIVAAIAFIWYQQTGDSFPPVINLYYEEEILFC
ncbi:hypothetical protein WH47_07464 [Habropoda laboriosa]|uniref:Uncharacterized protein n=1 Tax=Habropoda laboriosa TaxID=597456 RepID=A0A0L7QPQ2_9HYME|nr:hypothetical protein WH47_07464 [Habropoda laboriosa]